MLRLMLTSSVTMLVATTSASAFEVHSYASQVNDVDSVNSHWFETEDGVVLIDTQRIIPEAERMLEHLRATTDAPVVLVIVTHPHTDHFGGLPVVMDAYPDARVVTDATTLESLRTDGRGYIAARNERHGDRFETQERLTAAAAGAETVASGDRIEIGGETLAFEVVAESEAEATTIVDVLGDDAAFIGDLINVHAPAVPFEDIDNWLDQLDMLETRFDGNARLYQGHGPAPTSVAEIVDQRRFLTAMREGVVEAIEDGTLSDAETARIAFDLEARWPFYEGVAGNTRQQVLDFAVRTVAEQLGGEVETSG